MSYSYNANISIATTVTNNDVFGSMDSAQFHTVQSVGGSCVVALSIANNPNATTVYTVADGSIENINATGVTKFVLTPSAAADVSIGGL